MNDMNESNMNREAIAMETFKLLLNVSALKGDRFCIQLEERMRQLKMSQKKFYLLSCVDRKKNCTLSDIEKMLQENRSTASIAVSKLYRDGLIDKLKPEKEDDGRKVYFKVTRKGKEILDMFHGMFLHSVSGFYDSLSDEDKMNFLNGIVSLNKVFEGKTEII